ncbi:MAG: ABC transporter permease [Blastocatellia bacterium]
MNFADVIALAWRNLRQSKLRTALTVIGVIVGVAAIITMVSFGIGLRRNIIGQAFARLDAFTAITVLGADADDLLALSEGRTAFDEEEPEGPPEKSESAASPTPAGPAPFAESRSVTMMRSRATSNSTHKWRGEIASESSARSLSSGSRPIRVWSSTR